MVDEEVRSLIEAAHDEAWEILVENRDILDNLVLELLEKETLDKAAGRRDLRSRSASARPAPAWTGSAERNAVRARPGAHAEGARVAQRQSSTAARRSAAMGVDEPDRRARRRRLAGRPTGADARGVGPLAARGLSQRRSGDAVRPRRASTQRPSASSSSRSARTRTARVCRRPRPGSPGPTRRSSRGSAPAARGRPDDDVRPRPRRDGPGQGHRGALDLRAPPGAVPRRRPRRLHPVRRRADHRAVQAGPARRRLRPPPAGAGAADHAGRRRADAHPRAARRDRRDRVRAPVHVDARHPQAGRQDRHLRGARAAARPGDARRGDEPDHRPGEPATIRRDLPAARLAAARAGTPGHGRRQRHARLLQRRRRVSRRPTPPSRTGWQLAARAPTSSTSAASRPARARSGCPRTRSGAGSLPSYAPSPPPAPWSASTPCAPRWPPRRSTPAPRIVNDVSGGLADPAWPRWSAGAGTPYVAMHWRGHSADMAGVRCTTTWWPTWSRELGARRRRAGRRPASTPQVVLDPGLGFAKNAGAQLGAARRPDALAALGRPLLVGALPQGFPRRLLAGADGAPRPADERDAATAALSALAAAAGRLVRARARRRRATRGRRACRRQRCAAAQDDRLSDVDARAWPPTRRSTAPSSAATST